MPLQIAHFADQDLNAEPLLGLLGIGPSPDARPTAFSARA
jgi:hypothetical protein